MGQLSVPGQRGLLRAVERDLRALLRQESPDDRFAERLSATEIMTWRTPR
ncbi:hypothetical protein ABT300_26005 [Streptomyces sp. NPDC001027]